VKFDVPFFARLAQCLRDSFTAIFCFDDVYCDDEVQAPLLLVREHFLLSLQEGYLLPFIMMISRRR